MHGSKRSLRRVSVIFAITLVALLTSSPTGAQTSYPSKVVTPNYVEADTPLPLPINGGDDGYWEVPLPFDFTFYDVKYPQGHLMYVSTNGYINFLEPSSESFNACPITPPVSAPNGAIYALWDDLVVNGSASVGTRLTGTIPNRQLVIEWRNVSFFDPPLSAPDFEIILHETGTIVLQYRNIGSDGVQRGNSATIGLEYQSGNFADQFSCNTASLLSDPGEFAIQFGQDSSTPPPDDTPPPQPVLGVTVDIKPKHVLNWFNVARQGKLSVAILGKAGFDVKQIDPKSVRLAGVAPLYSWVENVRTHESHGWRRVFHRFGGRDRRLDLILKFDRRAIVAALDSVNHGDVMILKLSGKLKDGTEFSGQDSIRIINKAKKGKKNDSHHNAWRSTSHHDDDDDDHDEDDD